jgi:hypothetical protein
MQSQMTEMYLEQQLTQRHLLVLDHEKINLESHHLYGWVNVWFHLKKTGMYKNVNRSICFLSKDTHETMLNEMATLFMTNPAHLRSYSMVSDRVNHTALLPPASRGRVK